jgi:hypothetical protein
MTLDDLKISIFGIFIGGFCMWIGLIGIISSEKEMKEVTKYFFTKRYFGNLPIFKYLIVPDTEEWAGVRKVILKIAWVLFFLVGTFQVYKSVWHSG